MTARFFADTNVAVYALDVEEEKRRQAQEIMRAHPVISVQVVNEFMNAVLAKRTVDRATASRLARILMRRCEVMPLTAEVIDHALSLGERYQLSHWDALIVATALAAGCDTLYSEDMQHGQVFEGRLTVVNPFLVAGQNT